MNKIFITGRAGKDPETRTLENGTEVATISIATTETWKDKDGNKQEKTEWHNVVFWRGLAKVVGQYAKKGGLYTVVGKMTYRKYEDKEGVTRYTSEIVAEDFEMLGNPKDKESLTDQHQAQRAANTTGAAPFTSNAGQPDEADNDLPF